MLRIFSLIFLLVVSYQSMANPQPTLYQIDMIVFAEPSASIVSDMALSLLTPNTQHAIPLQNTASSALTPYHTLPTSSSQLNNEYWTLNHKTNYQIIAHHSWLQPANNQKAVALSANHNGWNMEGTVRIRRSNYYLLDTQLLLSTTGNHSTAFMFSQTQKLKPGVVYYLDHSHAGMLIKVHQIT